MKLRELDWDLKSDLVQDYWNEFETQLVGVADEIVPYKLFEFKTVVEPIPAMIKHKINERRRLLKSNKHYTTVIKTERIKVLNKDIKSNFNNAKASKVRRSIQPGNTSSLWKAIKTAKDLNTDVGHDI